MMNKKAMVGVITAAAITIGGGVGLAGYAMIHSHKTVSSAAKTMENKVADRMADATSAVVKTVEMTAGKDTTAKKPTADLTVEKTSAVRTDTASILAQKNAEKAAAEQAMIAKMEAEKAAEQSMAAELEAQMAEEHRQAVIEYLAGSPVYPEAMEVGMMACDCVSEITDLMGGSTAGDEYELTADQPILYTLEEDGSFELVDYYAPLEAGVKYFTKINVHCAEKAFAADVKMSFSLNEWHIAEVNGNTVTLCSPVIML